MAISVNQQSLPTHRDIRTLNRKIARVVGVVACWHAMSQRNSTIRYPSLTRRVK